MDSRLVSRPLIDLFSCRTQYLFQFNAASQRHQSSYRRTKQRLNVKPDEAFLISNNSPTQDHIIFNPPSSAPLTSHTPVKFLPKEDKRKQLFELTAKKNLDLTQTRLPPAINSPTIPHHHLGESDIAEIQRLKREEPDKWSNNKLARKFNCSSFFISICLSQCKRDDTLDKEVMKAKLEAVKARWGPRRKKAREQRAKRLELAFRGD